MKYEIVGIGNALVDVQLKVEDHFLSENSLIKGQMALRAHEEQKNLLDKFAGKALHICSGGSAANTIHGLGAMGVSTYYIGKVAADEYGHHYTTDMKNCGVGFPGPDAKDSGTGTSVILITPDAQRTMVTSLGISSSLHPENVDETIIKNARYVYIEGYLWTGDSTREAALKVAAIARKAGIPVAFTLSDVFVVNSFRKEIMDFIQWNVDILFCNDSEGMALTEKNSAGEAFDELISLADTVFFTCGKSGAWAKTQSQPRVEAHSYNVEAIDTTGAGDLFAAGALLGLLHNKSLKESVILGNYCASQVITHLGARLPAHSHKNISKIINEYQE